MHFPIRLLTSESQRGLREAVAAFCLLSRPAEEDEELHRRLVIGGCCASERIGRRVWGGRASARRGALVCVRTRMANGML